MVTYSCSVCSAQFNRGRGRPPKTPLCPKHDKKVEDKVREVKISARKVAKKQKWEPVPVVVEAPANQTIHGATGTAITAPCPACLYAYADGGFCPECGWMLPINRLPHGTATGRRYK